MTAAKRRLTTAAGGTRAGVAPDRGIPAKVMPTETVSAGMKPAGELSARVMPGAGMPAAAMAAGSAATMAPRAAAMTAALLMAVLACGCRPEPAYVRAEGAMLGTTYRVVADAPGVTSAELFAKMAVLDGEMKASMSLFDDSSLLQRLNRNETDSVDRHIEANLRLAKVLSAWSDGTYDVTVKPLVEAYGFAGKHRTGLPDVDSMLQFVGSDKVRIEGGRLLKSDPRVQLDFNSIAKGYTVDCAAALLRALGARNYLVEIGGEIRAEGVNASGRPWRIGVEFPVDDASMQNNGIDCRLQLSRGGMATSGNYRRFYIDSLTGCKVAHTIDPRTGRSAVSRLLSVTVVADSCSLADAMATMLLAMGEQRAVAWAGEHPDARLCFILSDTLGEGFVTRLTPAMKELLINTNE